MPLINPCRIPALRGYWHFCSYCCTTFFSAQNEATVLILPTASLATWLASSYIFCKHLIRSVSLNKNRYDSLISSLYICHKYYEYHLILVFQNVQVKDILYKELIIYPDRFTHTSTCNRVLPRIQAVIFQSFSFSL